jgi:hypothetical protein
MRPDVARDALLATHGGLSLEWCATICHLSPMAVIRKNRIRIYCSMIDQAGRP